MPILSWLGGRDGQIWVEILQAPPALLIKMAPHFTKEQQHKQLAHRTALHYRRDVR
jgi:hypothetical protein